MIITGLANRFGPKLLVFATALYTLLAPAIPNLLPDPTDPQSSLSRYYALSDIHRYMIWNTTYNHIKDRPIFGHGLDSTRALYSHEDRIMTQVNMKATGTRHKIIAEPIPLHPHNSRRWLIEPLKERKLASFGLHMARGTFLRLCCVSFPLLTIFQFS